MRQPQDRTTTTQAETTGAIDAELRSRGLRCTSARRLILGALRETYDHPTVEELSSSLSEQGNGVSVATIYQNLNRLADVGLVTRFLDSQGLLRFDANLAHHHHMLCTACGRVADIEVSEREASQLDVVADDLAAEHTTWQLENAQLELRGICPTCQEQ